MSDFVYSCAQCKLCLSSVVIYTHGLWAPGRAPCTPAHSPFSRTLIVPHHHQEATYLGCDLCLRLRLLAFYWGLETRKSLLNLMKNSLKTLSFKTHLFPGFTQKAFKKHSSFLFFCCKINVTCCKINVNVTWFVFFLLWFYELWGQIISPIYSADPLLVLSSVFLQPRQALLYTILRIFSSQQGHT